MRGAAFKKFPIHTLLTFVVLMVCFAAQPVWADDPAQHPPGKAPAEDANKVIARVLGKPITAQDRERMNGLIVSTLIQKFAESHKIATTEQEIDAFIERTAVLERQQTTQLENKQKQLQAELNDPNLAEPERKKKQQYLATIDRVLTTSRAAKQREQENQEQMQQMKRRMAGHFVNHWKVNKALFEQYGGRVIFQQAGAEPVDAYRDFLKEQETKGAFEILDPELKDPFWRYFTNDAMHTFYPEDQGAKFINQPWWMMDVPPMK